MLVTPRLFNYRLIIGALVVVIVALGSYSFSAFQSLKKHQDFLKTEVNLVQNELSEMIDSYDEVETNNKDLNDELLTSQQKLKSVLDSLGHLNADASIITKYKSQIASFKKERSMLFHRVSSVQKENIQLKTEVDSVSEELKTRDYLVQNLVNENQSLNSALDKIKSLTADNIHAEALNTINFSNIVVTDKVKKLDHIEVCATLSSSRYTPIGNKNIYIQILDPNNKVVEDRGTIADRYASLTYSGKTTINNTSNKIDVCTKININSKASLVKGTYKINIYQDLFPLGTTEMVLN